MARSIDFKRLSLLTGVGTVVVMVLYLTLYGDSNPVTWSLTAQQNPDRVDLYADLVHGLKYDASGRLVQQLWAQSMQHYPARGYSKLSDPKLLSLGKDGDLWNTTATTGILIGDEEIQLVHNVVITNQTNTTRFDTDMLRYFPDRQQVSTDAAVKLSHDNDVTTAVGMRADLNRHRIELLHQVQSTYAQLPH